MIEKPDISIVIPTFNGKKKIINLLQSIENQFFRNLEVIVVIDGSTDETSKAIKALNLSFRLIIISQSNKGRAAARNTGAAEAKSDLILFLDDDMRITTDTISKHIAFHNDFIENICLMGTASEDFLLCKTDFQKFKAYTSRTWEADLPSKKPLPQNNYFFMAAHLSLRKSLLQSLNGFDSSLSDAEDFELGIRIKAAQIAVYFDKAIIAYHDDFINCSKFINRQLQYKEAHQALKKSNPRATNISFYSFKNNSTIKAFVYMILKGSMMPWLIDNFNIFVVLPRKIRYKFYAAVVHSNLV
jgi:glycosyltransferase involved in cell wall biosynthesis